MLCANCLETPFNILIQRIYFKELFCFSAKSQEEDEEDSIDLRKTELVKSTQVKKITLIESTRWIILRFDRKYTMDNFKIFISVQVTKRLICPRT